MVSGLVWSGHVQVVCGAFHAMFLNHGILSTVRLGLLDHLSMV